MNWHRKLYRLEKDPNNAKSGPGMLHLITLEDETVGKPPFKFSTMMFIPLSMEKRQAELSLQLFEDSAHTQLEQKRDKWRGRDVVKRSSLVV